MKKILIPTDFSENAKDALSYALALEKGTQVKFWIIHVVIPILAQTPDGSVVNTLMTQNLISAAKSNMEALEAFASEHFKLNNLSNFEIETDVVVGEVIPLLKQKAVSSEIDLIIMGTKGSNHSTVDNFFGTISSSLLNNAPCPLIFVPLGYKYRDIDNVIFSTDLDPADYFELWKAFKVLEPHTPLVRFLHVKKNKEVEHDKKLKEFASFILESSPAISSVFNVEVGDNPEDFIENYGLEYGAELIMMAKRKKNIFQRIFRPNQTRKVLNKLTKVPLMVLN